MTTQGRYPGVPKPPGQNRPLGSRLTDPRDPAVREALTRKCPACLAAPDAWCVLFGPSVEHPGRRAHRIHYARARFTKDSE